MLNPDKKYKLRRWPVVLSLLAQRFHMGTVGKRFTNSRRLQLGYAVFGFVVLIVSSVFWSYLSAGLQQVNADQLVDPQLFNSPTVFHGAAFPTQHSYLLKWPLFYLIKIAGYSRLTFIIATMVTSVLTVLLFSYILYRIDRRPLIFGTLCLALASCLMLVPAQPYAGALLPVNMAMLTTRNFEYIIYIVGLALIARQQRLKNWHFWLAVLALGIVAASDRLFLDITVIGGGATMLTYAVRQRWQQLSFSANWLLASLLASALALGVLLCINASHLTHLVGPTGASPYGAVHTLKGLFLASIFGVSDVLTNFGANPAYDGTLLRQVPGLIEHRLLSISGISFLINGVTLLYGLLACYRVIAAGLCKRKGQGTLKQNTAVRLASMMIWSCLAAAVVFIAANHDYAVDSRYLTISLFAVFIALAVVARQKRVRADRIIGIGVVLVISLLAAVPQVIQTQQAANQVYSTLSSRNLLVAQALQTHHADTLVGDYWRVLPIQNVSQKAITALPLADCTEPRIVLTSQAWQPDLHKHSFAFLLTFDKGLTDYPACNLQQVTGKYGRPNATELIAGTLAKPSELLLFYDQGIQTSSLVVKTSTILPIQLDALPNTSCPVPSAMNVVAHEDDDILFMNPDIIHDIQAGQCVRTVYITAGDDGQGKQYWLAREQAAEAAYSAMIGVKKTWIQREVYLGDHKYVVVANPQGNHRISLIFMRLPDGGLRGQGFAGTHNEGLTSLRNNTITSVHSVDGQSVYSASGLVSSLTQLFATFQPALIRTQSTYPSKVFPDHSDHQAVSQFVQRAYTAYEDQQYGGKVTIPIKYYIGYPIHELPPNLSADDQAQKQAAFLAYAQYDDSVCHTAEQCDKTATYGAYLQREYQSPQ